MADDWIKFRKVLVRDPRVITLSRLCHAARVTVIGALVSLWCLADDYAEPDGRLPAYTLDDLDAEIGLPGFCAALPPDWLESRDGSIYLPQYQEHNGATAKARAQATRRKSRQREGDKPVTLLSRSRRDQRREEKRREELGDESPKTPLARSREDAASVPEGDEPGRRNQPTKNDAPALTFPVVGTERGVAVHEWRLTAAAVADYAEAYPGLDVAAECRKALQWVKSDPGRRKTARGMPRFLNGWLSRATNSGRGQRLPEANQPPRAETPIQRLARQRREEEACHRQTTLPGPTGTQPPSG